MLRLSSIWLLCVGLVLTRLLGLHVHACGGIEGTPHVHEAMHYADSGLVFGESHAEDDGDNLELDLAAAMPAAPHFSLVLQEPTLPAAGPAFTSLSSGWLTVRTPRGPPLPRHSRPSYLAPPLRGPPALSLA